MVSELVPPLGRLRWKRLLGLLRLLSQRLGVEPNLYSLRKWYANSAKSLALHERGQQQCRLTRTIEATLSVIQRGGTIYITMTAHEVTAQAAVHLTLHRVSYSPGRLTTLLVSGCIWPSRLRQMCETIRSFFPWLPFLT